MKSKKIINDEIVNTKPKQQTTIDDVGSFSYSFLAIEYAVPAPINNRNAINNIISLPSLYINSISYIFRFVNKNLL